MYLCRIVHDYGICHGDKIFASASAAKRWADNALSLVGLPDSKEVEHEGAIAIEIIELVEG